MHLSYAMIHFERNDSCISKRAIFTLCDGTKEITFSFFYLFFLFSIYFFFFHFLFLLLPSPSFSLSSLSLYFSRDVLHWMRVPLKIALGAKSTLSSEYKGEKNRLGKTKSYREFHVERTKLNDKNVLRLDNTNFYPFPFYSSMFVQWTHVSFPQS